MHSEKDISGCRLKTAMTDDQLIKELSCSRNGRQRIVLRCSLHGKEDRQISTKSVVMVSDVVEGLSPF